MNRWSIDRTKHKIFQDTVDISIEDWKMTYTWIKENGRILKVRQFHFIQKQIRFLT
jgi:hypothetical protein